jgi:hypothetical protein
MTASSPTGHDGIFISDQAGDGSFAAARRHGRLAHPFGSKQAFYATDGVRLAQSLIDVVNDALRSCRVPLVLIGDCWPTVVANDFLAVLVANILAPPLGAPSLATGAWMPAGRAYRLTGETVSVDRSHGRSGGSG